MSHPGAAPSGPEEELLRSEEVRQLKDMLRRLPPEQRDMVSLRSFPAPPQVVHIGVVGDAKEPNRKGSIAPVFRKVFHRLQKDRRGKVVGVPGIIHAVA